MTARVLFAAGGTGGHVYPALAIAEALRALDDDVQIRFVGGRRGIEGRLVPARGFRLERYPAAGMRGLGPMGALRFAVNFSVAAVLSLVLVLRWRPDLVVATGGYATAAPAAVASVLGVPLWLQEQNSAPGSTNRTLARLAERAYVAFPAARSRLAAAKAVHDASNPVRADVREAARRAPTPADYERFGLRPGVPTLLVFGGSGGATSLNRAMAAAWPRLRDETEWQVLLQTGERDLESTRVIVNRAQDESLRARVLSYIDDMAAAWRVADLVVCRAGALTLAELTTVGRAALLVPFPHATDDHQRHNAQALADAGAARWIDDTELDGDRLFAEVRALIDDPETRARMAAAARDWGEGTDGATVIARDALQRIHGKNPA